MQLRAIMWTRASSGHATLTEQLALVIKSDAKPPSAKDSPCLGPPVSRHNNSVIGSPNGRIGIGRPEWSRTD